MCVFMRCATHIPYVGSKTLRSSISLCHSPPYFLPQNLSLNWKLTVPTSLPDQQIPSELWRSVCLCLPELGLQACSYSCFVLPFMWDTNTGPHTSLFLSEPSPQPSLPAQYAEKLVLAYVLTSILMTPKQCFHFNLAPNGGKACTVRF